MSLVFLLAACGGGDWQTNWSGDWSGTMTYESGYFAGGTGTLALGGLGNEGHVHNYSRREGLWQRWVGSYGVDVEPGYYVEIWQCEDEDVCTSGDDEFVTGQFLLTGWANVTAIGSYRSIEVVGTVDGDEAVGDVQYGGFYSGEEATATFGTVALHRE